MSVSFPATQESGTQLAQNESLSLDASSTKGWSFSSTTSLQETTSAPGTSGLHVSSPTEVTTSGSPGSSSGNKKMPESTIHYSSVILPIVITLIVITLSVFSLVALYRVCQKKTPERQENGTEQAQSDKEGVKLLSVKTTSAETGKFFLWVWVCLSEPREEPFGDVISITKTIFSSCQVKVTANSSSAVQIPTLAACRAAVQLHCVWYQYLEGKSMTVLGENNFFNIIDGK
uniref:Endomucin n=1 Tax=Calidris pygmaea TaxID=425635 RepID=A0A8C3PIT0_9CHAR